MTNRYKEFTKKFEKAAHSHNYGTLFQDFLVMMSCALHTQNIATGCQVPEPQNEELYLSISKRYNKETLDDIAHLMGICMMQVYENEYSDAFGEFFQEYITRGQNGQFFTPEPVCQMMAQMVSSEKVTGKTFMDCACGSGRTLLSAAKINPDNYFFGADVDYTCALMAAINFQLNGLRGEVAWMNSITLECWKVWRINMDGLGILPIPVEQSKLYTKSVFEAKLHNKVQEKPKMILDEKVKATQLQLTLF